MFDEGARGYPSHLSSFCSYPLGYKLCVTYVIPSDDLSPPPRFHLSFLVQNEAGVTVRVITSDNDPPDGFRLEPEHSSIITKEVNNPSDLSIHAVVPGEEKTLLIDGQPRIVVAPSKATGDPLVFKITGKDGKRLHCLIVWMPSVEPCKFIKRVKVLSSYKVEFGSV